jgi:hypothetical protein
MKPPSDVFENLFLFRHHRGGKAFEHEICKQDEAEFVAVFNKSFI